VGRTYNGLGWAGRDVSKERKQRAGAALQVAKKDLETEPLGLRFACTVGNGGGGMMVEDGGGVVGKMEGVVGVQYLMMRAGRRGCVAEYESELPGRIRTRLGNGGG